MSANAVDVLRAFPLFKRARDETLHALGSAVRTSLHTHGDEIWHVGQLPTSAYFLSMGLVEIVRPTLTGDETALALFGPRECPGLFAVLDGVRFPASARVLSEDARLICIERAALLHAVDQDPDVARALTEVLRQHAAVLRAKVDVVTAGEVPQRLATLLDLLVARFGDEQDGALHIPLTLPRRVFARLVGARVETVIRVLSRWEKEGFVETASDGFVIRDAARLKSESGR